MGSHEVTEVMFESRPERNEEEATGLSGVEGGTGGGCGRDLQASGEGTSEIWIIYCFFSFSV